MSQAENGGESKRRKRVRWGRLATISGGLSGALGTVVLVGWHAGFPALLQVRSSWVPMQYNTALGFLLTGVGLVAMNGGRRRLAFSCAAGLSALGGLTLVQYLTGMDLGIDQVLMKHYLTLETSHPGRMAPNTALCFVLAGAAMLAPGWWKQTTRSAIAGVLGCVVSGFGVVAFFGYTSGLESAYEWGGLTPMAIHTAAGMIAVGFGLFFRALAEEPRFPRRSAPWVAVAVGLAVLTVFVSLWEALTVSEQASFESEVIMRAAALRQEIETALSVDVLAVGRMAARWERRRPSRIEWESDATNYASDRPSIEAMLWVDRDQQVRWTVSSEPGGPVPDNPPGEELEQLFAQVAGIDRGSSGRYVVPVASGSGRFRLYEPLRHAGTFDGVLVGVFRLDPLLVSMAPADGLRAELLSNDGRPETAGTTDVSTGAVDLDLRMGESSWPLRVTVDVDALHQGDSLARWFVLWAGLACALLVAILMRQVQRAREAAKLERANNELLHSNEALERFAYVVSHDLKEPLRMVASYMRLLESKYEGRLDGEADDFIRFAADGAQRMMTMIEDVLAYSRMTPDRKVAEPTELAAAVESALANLELLLQENDARVRCRANASVLADGGQLSQLFQNLIANAVKFRGATSPEIDIDAVVDGELCVVSVRDNGIGIAPEHHQSVFEVFKKLGGKHKTDGSGIGLAVCQRIVEQHGGRIWVESELGRGTTFRFSLPSVRAAGAECSHDDERAA